MLALSAFPGFYFLFPLHRSRRLRSNIIHNAVYDTLHLICNSSGHLCQNVIRNPSPVGCHEVICRDCANRNQICVGPMVAHDTHSIYAGKDAEELRQILLIAVLFHLVSENPVRFLENRNFFSRNLTDDTHTETGAREGLTPNELMGQSQGLADFADLVFEELYL